MAKVYTRPVSSIRRNTLLGLCIEYSFVNFLHNKKRVNVLYCPTGSEGGDEDDDMCSEDEDSDDSFTTQEEFTAELILG